MVEGFNIEIVIITAGKKGCHEPYIGHTEVENPEAIQQKIQLYHDMGIRHLKVYWRLRYPELKAALKKANELEMNVAGHIMRLWMYIRFRKCFST